MRSFTILAAAAALAACSGNGAMDEPDAQSAADAGAATVDAPVSGGTPDAPTSGGTPDARAPDASSSSGSPDAGGAPTTSGTGNVSLTQTVIGNNVTYRTNVVFVKGTGVGGCPVSKMGPCVVFTCPAMNDPADIAG